MSTTAETTSQTATRPWVARLRVAVPLVFLVLVGWLVVREIGSDFDLPQMQRTLIGVPTLPAIAVAVLALSAVAFSGLVDVAIAHWLGIKVATRELLRLAFVANAMANTLNLSGATGSGVRLLGLSAQKVELNRAAALIGMQVLSLPLGLSILIAIPLAFLVSACVGIAIERLQKDQAELAADLVARDEFMMSPGETRPLTKVLNNDTRFIAVFAAFRDLERATWRAVVPVQAHQKHDITVRADGLVLSATAKIIPPPPPPPPKK
jgi:hypothetical protein